MIQTLLASFLLASSSFSYQPSQSQILNQHAIELAYTIFSGTPLMAVASCESEFRQLESEGTVLIGKANKDDVGFMQINKKYHLNTSVSMGLDIYSYWGNITYAKWLYDHYGLAPWKASESCWKSKLSNWQV